MKSLAAFASILLPLALVACAPAEEADAVPDDADFGDSIADLGKDDSVSTVPKTMMLNKNKIIYLTFDDGPSPTVTPHVLDILAKHHAHATFFITGLNIAGHEDLIRREVAEGHNVGNHQWQHVIATQAQFQTWVYKERDSLKGIVNDPTMPLYFRYPYGAGASWKEPILKAAGYLDGGVGWDIDSLDWDYGNDEKSVRPEVPKAYQKDYEGWILYQLQHRSGGVILMHDVQSIEIKHLDSVLTKLEAQGYTFGVLPHHRAYIGEGCATTSECAYSGAVCIGEGESTGGGLCSLPCTSSCPDVAGHGTTRCVRVPDENGAQMDLCATECPTAGCGAGTTCQPFTSPTGVARNVCWQ